MNIQETYCLNREILSIHSEGGRRAMIMIPAGAIVKITNGPLDGQRLVDVLWEGKTVMVFTEDLRERGSLVSDTQNGIAGRSQTKSG